MNQVIYEINTLTLIICLGSLNFSFSNVTEKLVKSGIHCLPCSWTNSIIYFTIEVRFGIDV